MHSQQYKIKEHPHLEQPPYFIFLDALQNYLKLEQNTSKNLKLVESMYDQLKKTPKFILQFNFFDHSVSCHSHNHYTFNKASPFSNLMHLGLYKIRILKTIDFDAFNNFLSFLISSVNKEPIKTHHYNTESWGAYFIKTTTPSFKSVLNKALREFSVLDININKHPHILSFLETLKTYPDSPKLRKDLETLLFFLVKNQRYHDALNLIETYTQANFPLKNNASLWSPNVLTKVLNHLKFFKIHTDHEEACENLLSTIPTEFFMLCFEHIEQITLHPKKMIFIRYLARIHKGDSGFLQKIFTLSPVKSNTAIYQKSLKQLLFIMDSPINPQLIIGVSQHLTTSKKRNLIRLLLPHCDNKPTCAWLIQNLNYQSKAEQHHIIRHIQNIRQPFAAQLLIDKVVKQKQFWDSDPTLKEAIYDAILANSPKLFTEHLQNHRLKKGLLFKTKYLNDYVCLEKVLKKNQYFSKSLTLKKIQKISKSIKIHLLKKVFTFLRLIPKNTL